MLGRWLGRNKGRAEASYAKLHGGSCSGQTYCRLQTMVGRANYTLTQCNLWWIGTTDTLYGANFEGHRLQGPQAMLQCIAMVFIVITFIVILITWIRMNINQEIEAN